MSDWFLFNSVVAIFWLLVVWVFVLLCFGFSIWCCLIWEFFVLLTSGLWFRCLNWFAWTVGCFTAWVVCVGYLRGLEFVYSCLGFVGFVSCNCVELCFFAWFLALWFWFWLVDLWLLVGLGLTWVICGCCLSCLFGYCGDVWLLYCCLCLDI